MPFAKGASRIAKSFGAVIEAGRSQRNAEEVPESVGRPVAYEVVPGEYMSVWSFFWWILPFATMMSPSCERKRERVCV